MKKERILYFDIIKLLALICVLVCHYMRTLDFYQISYNFKLLPDNIFSIYTGTVGCVLFFIVSGASLEYVYHEQLKLKTYFIKRFKGIYPMFWISFVIFFCIYFYIDGGYNKNIPRWKIILSMTGFDGIVNSFSSTFWTVGEWFLGVLIILYILFPILKKLVDEFPYPSLAVSTLVGVIFDYTYSNSHVDISVLFIVWIPAFVLGMVFVKRIKRVSNCLLIVSMIVLTIFTIFDLNFVYKMTSIYFVGASLFFILVYLFQDRVEKCGGGGIYVKLLCREILLSDFFSSSSHDAYSYEKIQ